jgi:hypothetical protein
MFALLDPDPDCESGSGSRDLIESGSGSRDPIESGYGSRDPIESGYGYGSGSTALLSRIVGDLRELGEQDVALLIVVQTEEHSRHVHQLLAYILLIMRHNVSDFRCNTECKR